MSFDWNVLHSVISIATLFAAVLSPLFVKKYENEHSLKMKQFELRTQRIYECTHQYIEKAQHVNTLVQKNTGGPAPETRTQYQLARCKLYSVLPENLWRDIDGIDNMISNGIDASDRIAELSKKISSAGILHV